jgi:hypothetical protein
MPMWSVALFVLVPGNFIGAWLVEKLFWHTSLSLTNMGVASTFLLLVINAAFWFVGMSVIRGIYGRARTLKNEDDNKTS